MVSVHCHIYTLVAFLMAKVAYLRMSRIPQRVVVFETAGKLLRGTNKQTNKKFEKTGIGETLMSIIAFK